MKKILLSTIVCIVFLIIVFANLSLILAQTADANTSIQLANSSINQAFENISAAERAGGNVTVLLQKLNSATALLADAENAYNAANLNENTTSAISYANSARLIAIQANSEALALLNTSNEQSQNHLILTLLFSFIAASIFSIVLFAAWRRFKRAYTKKLLRAKPEVIANGT